MKKGLFSFDTRTMVATGLGAALFLVLFMFVKVPTGVPNTEIQTAYGLGAFMAALFGPIAGALIQFIGHALSDTINGAPWWSWIIASGVAGFIIGLAKNRLNVRQGEFNTKTLVRFLIYVVIAHVVAWCIVAPGLDVLIYSEPASKVFAQSLTSVIANIISSGVIGGLLLFAVAKSSSGKGQLKQEDE
ncbi:MAG: ECF-type riboflavin transporter substrate-binding protein [Peptoniphilaceae bacterium]|nr:ECF-type riboflavin transporter substrate-binding protein [Peptoniphilaceae bacterium]MDD7433495.1 ECF-type riboflavin transporter substrate-binding protein [Peptoniphilaceae bacterium]MDY3076261.1 ECF-type riboflavin transporter substrate-binding protein [Peptoniphilaceae bacterium]MDY4196390.1 ECF-type riboflavin transporter substrate-binding protein [Peptoniphilaceae bacterium]MDY5842057.1 ECF-type riboflavin transporter substrate-binding protein [Peptoniphilaceae bacterium]